MSSRTPYYLIFTDLDGTLLDHVTYEWKDALPALSECRRRGVPVILASSKTRAEIEVIRTKMGLRSPFISENGGGVFIPVGAFPTPPDKASDEDGFWKISLGMPYSKVVTGLREIREELRWDIRGFSDMDMHEIASLTGLDPQTASLAAMREFEEPFVIRTEHSDEGVLHEAARKRGLHIISGGRFYHLQGPNDKALAMQELIRLYRRHLGDVVSVALGDSPNDFRMLEKSDCPILVRSDRHYPDLARRIRGLRMTQDKGPRGWNSAVMGLLKGAV